MRLKVAFIAMTLLLATAQAALAATEVRMAGDARVYGVFFANRNFTGWDETGTQTEDRMTIWQRLRLRTDFVANENLKFRFGMRVDDEAWGHGYLTAANPQAVIEPYLAYLQFKFPGTDIEVTAGYQPLSVPHTEVFYDSIVLAADDGDQSSAALHVNIPVGENFSIQAAYARLLDAHRTFQSTTTQVGDAFDIYQLALPVTVDGFSATPWGLVGVYGKDSDPEGLFNAGLRSAGSYLNVTGYPYKDNQNPMWWAGLAMTVEALDPFKFYADAIYGDAAPGDRERNRRRGYFIDAGITYSGLDWMLPGVFGWVSSGEDSSLSNGSERLPVITPKWGPGTSFLFDADQEFANNNMGVDPTGTWGLAASLRDISFIEALKSRLTFAAIAGNNSPAGLRKAVAASGGVGEYVSMGRNLATGEWVLGVNFDHSYEITEQLSLTLQTGFASPQGLKTSIWGHRFTNQAENAYMASLGLLYTF
ncbi:outer membrane homotrimeric porin [Solidesulfovibrio sp.]|uniref:outer membrane homotrimeric porin n=1 Tax=Solidesulfovibrio sp. TaxID=2910990 RepID=UPI002618816C|nr:outer membrane homotrimeric porin [Solidesulfovibrio sp.]